MHNALMEEPSDRLRAARIAAGYVDRDGVRKAAEAMRVPYATYAGHENGSRGITASAGRRYANFYKISAEWLLYGKGTPKAGQLHPILEIYESLSRPKQEEAFDFLRFLKQK